MKEDILLQRIRAEFPDIKWKQYKYINHGWDHDIVILDSRIVFRIPKETEYINKLKHEIKLLNYLSPQLNIDIPDYQYIAKDKSFAGYHIVKGKELYPKRYDRLSTPDKKNAAKQFAVFISTLHSTPKTIISDCRIETENLMMHNEELFQKVERLVYPLLTQPEIRRIKDYYVELQQMSTYDFPKTLVHRDLTEEHILWDDKQKQINIIDFSDCALGDPAIDFSGILIYGEEFFELVCALYTGSMDTSLKQRARLSFQRIPLYIMMDSQSGFPCTFEEGYKLFKERFSIT